MIDPLLLSFSSFDDATRARQALIEAGFDPDALQLRVLNDEAGPVEGNFVTGNGRGDRGQDLGGHGADDDTVTPYGTNFERAVWHGGHLLMVAAQDPARRAQAVETAGRLGGTDVATVAAASGSAQR